MTTKVLYPGSFDPLHNGHVEIIETAAGLFDHVVVAAMRNPHKGEPLFTLDQRMSMITDSLAHLANVSVVSFGGLVVDLARDVEADFIVKGLRAVSDFEGEMQMALTNRKVSGVVTLFLPSGSEHSFLASKYIRDMAKYGRDVGFMVPPAVAKHLEDKYPR